MTNYRRVKIPGGIYFFTVVTYKRRPIFTNESRVKVLRDAFAKIKKTKPFDIDAIVILPDHLHCIWRLPQGDRDYSGRWREIKKVVSGKLSPQSDKHNERHLWQRRFWEHAIRDIEDWRKHMDYIHYKPVKHRLSKFPADWPWSSFSRCVKKGWYSPKWGLALPENIEDMELE